MYNSAIILAILYLCMSHSTVTLKRHFSAPPKTVSIISTLIFLSGNKFPIIYNMLWREHSQCDTSFTFPLATSGQTHAG